MHLFLKNGVFIETACVLEAEVAFNKGFQQREHKGTKEKPCKRGFLCGPSVTKAYKERDHRETTEGARAGGGNTKESLEQLGVNRCGPPRPGHDQLHLLLPGRSRDRNGLEARRRGRSILYINIDTYAHMA